MNDFISRRWRWDGAIGMPELDRVRDDLAHGITLDKFETPVRVKSRTNVEALLGTEVPRATSGGLSMDKHTTTNRAQRGLVEIKWPLEEFPSRYRRIERRLSEEDERELSLRKE